MSCVEESPAALRQDLSRYVLGILVPITSEALEL